jgi:protein translocase SEC61 complex gamma subunit
MNISNPFSIPKIKQFFESSKHVLSVSYKPGMSEFRRTIKIVLLGILIIGVMGYIISLIIGFLI